MTRKTGQKNRTEREMIINAKSSLVYLEDRKIRRRKGGGWKAYLN